MRLDFFLLAAGAGFLATYVHLVLALWAPRVGLPRLDFAKALADLTFRESFDGAPPYWLGLLAVHLNGIVFALVYAMLVGPLLPGVPLLRGLIWGAILFVASQCFFVPVFLRDGFFGVKGHRRAWITAALAHGAYGAILGWLCPLL
jgi:hypothetical protein